MDPKDCQLTPTSMPSSFEYASDSQYETCTESPAPLRKTSKQLQHSPAGRSNGLLGKMFRKGPPKHPKLNPVGISSKDFFSADQSPPPPLPKEHGSSAKGSKLARKLSSLSSSSHLPTATPSVAVSPQSLTPKSTIIPAFSSSAAVSSFGCLSDSDTMDDSAHSVSHTSALLHNTPTGSRHIAHQQQQRLDWSLPQIGRSAGYEVHCDSFGTAEMPQRRRPSRLKLDMIHASGRTSTASPVTQPPHLHSRSHDSAESAHFSPTLHRHQPHADDASSPPDTAAASASALLTMYADAERGLSAGESRKRGALWRAKLSFTNLRRPESRRQRHQSFDSNSVDIAAHSRMYSESPLVSVPSTAPASARSRTPRTADYEQSKLEGYLGLSPNSRFAQSPVGCYGGDTGTNCDELASVDDLGTIDKEFLLTIQRNSALEARRQRRRETRRNTMSFLSSANMPSPLHEAASLEIATTNESTSAPPSADKTRLAICDDDIGHIDASTTCSAGETAGHESRYADDGLKDSNDGGIMPNKGSPSGTRPTSLDSLTYSEQAVAGSSRPNSNVCGGKQSLVVDNLHNDSHLPRSPQSQPRPQAPPDAIELPSGSTLGSAWSPSRHSAVARTYCSLQGVDDDSSVPPVPPLPTHIALVAHHNQRNAANSDAHTDSLVRPVTANARGSPRYVTDARRYRGSASVLPTMTEKSSTQRYLSPTPLGASLAPPPLRSLNSPMEAALAASSWDAEAIRLQRYRLASGSGRHYPDTSSNSSTPVAESRDEARHASPSLPLSAHVGRKFSQPDTHLTASPRPLDSPAPSPGILSKSTPHINMRSSVDSNHANSGGSAKHGIGRLFSATPPGRKSQLGSHHLATSPPTSPTVSSLVGDPMARRKIRDQLASSQAFDRLLEEDDEFTMAISLTPSVAGMSPAIAPSKRK
ncbi:hypothetical protein GGI21_000849 [Coemansia aciculifera]|nr:hypothetical protein GGI21_000849 [Coemansia aciculifera]